MDDNQRDYDTEPLRLGCLAWHGPPWLLVTFAAIIVLAFVLDAVIGA